MLTSRGLGTVLGDLAALGFDARWGVVSAADVGAPHLRERIWIVGHANVHGIPASNEKQVLQRKPNRTRENIQQSARSNISEISNSNSDSQSTGAINAEQVCESDIPDTDNGRRGRREISGEGGNGRSEFYGENEQVADAEGVHAQRQHKGSWETQSGRSCWWPSEPNVGRVANGVAARVDRLKAIGNGQVPAVAATAWRLLN